MSDPTDKELLEQSWEEQRELKARLGRIRACAESDAGLAHLPAVRDFLLRETDLGLQSVFGLVPGAGLGENE